MLKKFCSQLRSYCGLTHLLLLVVVVLALIVLPDSTLAADPAASPLSGYNVSKIADGIKVIAYWVVGGILFLISFIAIGVGDLMDSTFIYDAGMGETLYTMWSTIRDFVNIGFILALLGLAVLVILGLGDEGGLAKLKKILPKLIIGLILVNFTFFGTRIVLTTSDVLATAIFSLPGMVNKVTTGPPIPLKTICGDLSLEACKTLNRDKILFFWNPTTKKVEVPGDLSTALKERIDQINTNYSEGGIFVKDLSAKFDKKNAMFTTMLYMLHVVDLQHIKSPQQNVSAIVGSLFSIVLAVMLGVLVFAMGLGLIVRMVVLWVLIALSPILVLGWVFKELVPQVSEAAGGLDLDKQFITNAFLPVFIAVPMSIGFTMIFAEGTFTQITGIYGATEGAQVAFFKLIWLVAAFVIIWIGTFKALGKSEAVGKITEKIKGTAEGFAGGAMKTLSYMPVIPGLSKDGSLSSIGSVLSAPSKIEGMLAGQTSTRSREIATPMATSLGYRQEFRADNAFATDVKASSSIKDLAQAIKTHHDSNGTNVTLTPTLKDKLTNIGLPKAIVNSSKDLASLLANTQIRGKLAKEGGAAGKEVSDNYLSYNKVFKDRQKDAEAAKKETSAAAAAGAGSLTAGSKYSGNDVSGSTNAGIQSNDRDLNFFTGNVAGDRGALLYKQGDKYHYVDSTKAQIEQQLNTITDTKSESGAVVSAIKHLEKAMGTGMMIDVINAMIAQMDDGAKTAWKSKAGGDFNNELDNNDVGAKWDAGSGKFEKK